MKKTAYILMAIAAFNCNLQNDYGMFNTKSMHSKSSNETSRAYPSQMIDDTSPPEKEDEDFIYSTSLTLADVIGMQFKIDESRYFRLTINGYDWEAQIFNKDNMPQVTVPIFVSSNMSIAQMCHEQEDTGHVTNIYLLENEEKATRLVVGDMGEYEELKGDYLCDFLNRHKNNKEILVLQRNGNNKLQQAKQALEQQNQQLLQQLQQQQLNQKDQQVHQMLQQMLNLQQQNQQIQYQMQQQNQKLLQRVLQLEQQQNLSKTSNNPSPNDSTANKYAVGQNTVEDEKGTPTPQETPLSPVESRYIIPEAENPLEPGPLKLELSFPPRLQLSNEHIDEKGSPDPQVNKAAANSKGSQTRLLQRQQGNQLSENSTHRLIAQKAAANSKGSQTRLLQQQQGNQLSENSTHRLIAQFDKAAAGDNENQAPNENVNEDNEKEENTQEEEYWDDDDNEKGWDLSEGEVWEAAGQQPKLYDRLKQHMWDRELKKKTGHRNRL